MLHWHSPREDLIGVIALIVYVITCGSLSGGRNGSIFDSHTIYFLSFGAFNLQESPLRIRGKSTALVFAAPTAEDHPRACGEKPTSISARTANMGSPPRMRGKASLYLILNCTLRITPAHAGKRYAGPPRVPRPWDHPRACGEKITACLKWSWPPGSPPRMRGKGVQNRSRIGVLGITPAHAGKSICHGTCRRKRRDHPRACGEKFPLML